MEYTETPLWKQTLGQETNDTSKSPIEHLRGAYIQFREHAKQLAHEIALSMPDYTDHSIKHSDSLWSTASILIGDKVFVNPAEAFVLGGAFLVHDLGMGLSAYEGGIKNIISDPQFLDLLAKSFPVEHSSILQKLEKDISINSTWNGVNSLEVKHVLAEYMRQNHAKQAETLMTQEWKLSNGQSTYLIADDQVRNWYSRSIGRVAKSHWCDVSRLEESVQNFTSGAPGGLPPDWTVDELKIACLLRLADAINIDNRRANILLTPHRQPTGISRTHWKFQEKMNAPHVVDKRIIFNTSSPFSVEEIDEWWMAFDTVRGVDAELRQVDNLCADLGLPRFGATGVSGADSSIRFSKFVQTEGWLPIDASPHISDNNLVIENLGGKALYGDLGYQWVPIREILANAMDATRAIRSAYTEETPRPILFTLHKGEVSDRLIIQDYGIGMTENDIIDHLCNFGSSGWMSGSVSQAIPGAISSGFKSAGRFGIGFFSVFMISNEVRVVTRHIDARKQETLVLSFGNGLASRPVLRTADRHEQLMYPGTRVELTLKVRAHDKDGIFRYAPNAWSNDIHMLARIVGGRALMSTEDINVQILGGDGPVRAISGNSWEKISPQEILQLMNPIVNLQRDEYSGMLKRFSESLTDISNSNGTTIGRIGIDIMDHPDDPGTDFYLSTGEGFIGGLYSRPLTGIVGILQGEPSGAARDKIRFDVPMEQLQTWYSKQVEHLLESKLNTDQKSLCDVQTYGIRMGSRSDQLPIGFGSEGYMNPRELAMWLESHEEITIISHTGSYLALPEDKLLGYQLSGGDFVTPISGHFVVPFSLFLGEEDEPLPIRKDRIVEALEGYSSDEDSFDPNDWWMRNYLSPSAEVIRICSEVWEVEVQALLSKLEGMYDETDCDNRLLVRTIAGSLRRVPAVVVRRP